MNWRELETEVDLDNAIEISFSEKTQGVVFFKHSTRCSISHMAKARLVGKWKFGHELPIYHLDLLKHQNLSKVISQKFSVIHESPQLLLVRGGKCIYHASHNAISVSEIENFLSNKDC